MKKIHINESQKAVINEDAEIIDINGLLGNNDINSDDGELSPLDTLESLVDDVMDAVEAVRDYYLANEGCFGEKESYAKKIDNKMSYILSDLF
jgi:hypothetical protein